MKLAILENIWCVDIVIYRETLVLKQRHEVTAELSSENGPADKLSYFLICTSLFTKNCVPSTNL